MPKNTLLGFLQKDYYALISGIVGTPDAAKSPAAYPIIHGGAITDCNKEVCAINIEVRCYCDLSTKQIERLSLGLYSICQRSIQRSASHLSGKQGQIAVVVWHQKKTSLRIGDVEVVQPR